MIFVLVGLLIIIGLYLGIKDKDFEIVTQFIGVIIIVTVSLSLILLIFGTKSNETELNTTKLELYYIDNKYYYKKKDDIKPLDLSGKYTTIIKDSEEYLLLTKTRNYYKLNIIGKIILFKFDDNFVFYKYDYTSNYELHIKSK